jgi:hypothetical protein
MNNQNLIHQATFIDLDSLWEMGLLLRPDDKTILSIKQEITQILVDERHLFFLQRKILLMLALHIVRFVMIMWKVMLQRPLVIWKAFL